MKLLLNTLREYASLIPQPGIMDIIDILVVAYLFYRIFMLIRQTAAARIARSILLILLVAGLTRLLQMHALHSVLSYVLELGAFALIIIFQPELRRGLERIGGKRILGMFSSQHQSTENEYVIDQTVRACDQMSRKRVGALIVFERTIPLEQYFASGTIVDAKVSEQLICNIFFPKAALHDGAMIIRNERVAAAGCVLPLTENPRVSTDLGTRHRAGIGMSEVSDALVIIVSEETGTISVADQGMLKRHLAPQTLKKLLTQELLNEDSSNGQGIVGWLRKRLTSEGRTNEKK